MTIRFAALALLALPFAVPAAAAPPSAEHADHAEEHADATDGKAAKERKVCRSETRTGSNMPRRVCRTVAQMEDDERRAEQFRDQQNRMGASAR